MAIKKKLLNEAIKTAYSSIPLATSNNNGLLDKNMYSKACYMNQSPACIARVCNGGLVGILSIFKDHEDYHDVFMVHCYKRTSTGNVEVTRLSANTTDHLIKVYYYLNNGYMQIYVKCDPYCDVCFTPLGFRSPLDNPEMNFTAYMVDSIPSEAVEISIT